MGEFVTIRSVKPGQKDIALMFIVLDVNRPTKTKEGHEVRTVKVADRSGSINLSMWDELGKQVQSGDIIRMTKGYANIWKSCLTLYVSKSSEFIKVGEFCYIFNELPFMSEPNPELVGQPQMDNRGSASGGAQGNNKIMRANPPGTGNSGSPHDPRSGPGGAAPQPAPGVRYNGGSNQAVLPPPNSTNVKWGQQVPPHDNRQQNVRGGGHGSTKDKIR